MIQISFQCSNINNLISVSFTQNFNFPLKFSNFNDKKLSNNTTVLNRNVLVETMQNAEIIISCDNLAFSCRI